MATISEYFAYPSEERIKLNRYSEMQSNQHPVSNIIIYKNATGSDSYTSGYANDYYTDLDNAWVYRSIATTIPTNTTVYVSYTDVGTGIRYERKPYKFSFTEHSQPEGIGLQQRTLTYDFPQIQDLDQDNDIINTLYDWIDNLEWYTRYADTYEYLEYPNYNKQYLDFNDIKKVQDRLKLLSPYLEITPPTFTTYPNGIIYRNYITDIRRSLNQHYEKYIEDWDTSYGWGGGYWWSKFQDTSAMYTNSSYKFGIPNYWVDYTYTKETDESEVQYALCYDDAWYYDYTPERPVGIE